MNEEINKKDDSSELDVEVQQTNGKPYGINWNKLSNGDKAEYRRLLEYFEPVQLWKDYGEYLLCERKDKEYYQHIFLEKEAYLSLYHTLVSIQQKALDKQSYLSFISLMKEDYSNIGTVDYLVKMLCGVSLVFLSGFQFATSYPLDDGTKLMTASIALLGLSLLVAGALKKGNLTIRRNLDKWSTIEYEKRNLKLKNDEGVEPTEQ